MLAGSFEPLFFMHIGKTAGSYVKRCLVEAYRADRVLEFCEYLIGPFYDPTNNGVFSDKDVVSGHIYVEDWNEFSCMLGYKTKYATVLRAPLQVLVSTLRYLDSFNYPEKLAETKNFHEDFLNIFSRIEKIDFRDAGSIDEFFTNLSPLCMMMFDNPQSRYFLAKAWSNTGDHIAPSDPISLDMQPRIKQAMAQFSVVGLTERLPESLWMLSDLVGRPIPALDYRVNETVSPRMIDLGDKWIRRVLEKRIIVDDWLYQHAAEAFEARITGQRASACAA